MFGMLIGAWRYRYFILSSIKTELRFRPIQQVGRAVAPGLKKTVAADYVIDNVGGYCRLDTTT